MNLTSQLIVDLIKDEADRLVAQEKLALEAAYTRAVPLVFMRLGEKARLSAVERQVLAAMRKLQSGKKKLRALGRGQIVHKVEDLTEWQVWNALRKLERKGLVHRPTSRTWSLVASEAAAQAA